MDVHGMDGWMSRCVCVCGGSIESRFEVGSEIHRQEVCGSKRRYFSKDMEHVGIGGTNELA
jgi:hypothetical protein